MRVAIKTISGDSLLKDNVSILQLVKQYVEPSENGPVDVGPLLVLEDISFNFPNEKFEKIEKSFYEQLENDFIFIDLS